MTRPFVPPSEEERARIRQLADEPLSPEEFQRRLAIPLTDEEISDTLELVRWFRRRYPSVLDRLRYCDREYRAWNRPLGK